MARVGVGIYHTHIYIINNVKSFVFRNKVKREVNGLSDIKISVLNARRSEALVRRVPICERESGEYRSVGARAERRIGERTLAVQLEV